MAMVFYDTETTGIKPHFDQILQFAAILTDNDLNEIERFEIRSRLLPNVVPSPGAMNVTNIPVATLHNTDMPSYYQMTCRIREKLLSWQPAIFIGHNSLRFDEAFLRSAFYKNLFPPYLTNTGGSSRMDTLSMLQWAHSYEPEALVVPTRSDGGLIFKLDRLAPANGFEHSNAHEAMSDVEATIFMAALLRDNAPETWSRAMRFSSKHNVIDFCESELVFGLTEYYFNRPYSFLMHQLGRNPHDGNEIIAFDLSNELEDFRTMSPASLRRRLSASPKPIRRFRANSLPGLVDADDAQPLTRLKNVSQDEIEDRAEELSNDEDLKERLMQAYLHERPEYEDSPHVEENIYSGFASPEDNLLMEAFHEADWSDRAPIVAQFEDPRFRELGEQLIFFESPDALSEERQQYWRVKTNQRLLGTGEPCSALTLPDALQQANDLILTVEGAKKDRLIDHRTKLENDLTELGS